jgi:hypothetical protein
VVVSIVVEVVVGVSVLVAVIEVVLVEVEGAVVLVMNGFASGGVKTQL